MPFMKPFSSLARELGLDRAAVGYGLRLAFAAWLAFAIAASLHVRNAYWAAMPAWVVAEATRGLLLERGVLRVLGTLAGAAFGFAVLQATAHPYAQLAGLGVWVAICSALTHLLRGMHAYGALMSGITAAIVILPSVLKPDLSMEITMARLECTLIGVVVVTLVTGLFTPWSEREAFYRRVRRLAGDAVAFAAAALREEELEALERHILTEISEVEAKASLVSAGSIEGYRRLRHVHALVAASLGVMAAGRALRERQAGQPFEALPQALATLAERLREAMPGVAPRPDWRAVNETAAPISARLAHALHDLREADTVLFWEPQSADAKSFGKKAVYLAPHYDWTLARRTGLVCGSVSFFAATLGLASGWQAGLLAALGVTIFSLILSGVPLPQVIGPKLFAGVCAGVIVAVGYRLGIQPHLSTTTQLIVSVAPFILLGSLARASPRLAIPALEANMCFMFVSQAGMPPAGFYEILEGAGSLMAAVSVVVGGFMLLPRLPARQAREVAALIRRDLARLMANGEAHTAEWQPQTARQILRLTVHLGRADELGAAAPRGLLSALNLGYAVADLRGIAAQPDAAPATRAEAGEALRVLGGFAEDPKGIASRLLLQADAAGDPAAAEAMRAAAAALRTGAGLFEFGAASA